MKQIKKKTEDKSKTDDEWYWCPLFSSLPIMPSKYLYPSSIVSKCISIINEVRSIFGIEKHWLNPKSLDPVFIERKTVFPKIITLSARAIAGRSERIIDDAQCIAENWESIKTKNGIIHKFNPDQVDIDILRQQIGCTVDGLGKFYGLNLDGYELKDYEIYLLLALSEAWYLMEDILDDDCIDDNYSLKNIRMIELLLTKAKELKGKAIRSTGGSKKRNITKEFCKYRIEKSTSATCQSVFDYLKNNHKKAKPWKMEGRGIYWRASQKIGEEKGIIIEYDIKTSGIIKRNNFKSFQRNFIKAKI